MASQLGSEIISYYNALGRGGLNANGVEIEFVFVSTEVSSNWDNSINNQSQNNSFQFSFLDATNNRSSNVRAGFSFFRGQDSSAPPGNLPFSQRRRIVILNNTDPNNPIILYNDLPLSSGSLGSAKVTEIRTAIDSANFTLSEQSYSDWTSSYSFPLGLESPNADPDLDGATNIEEFFAGTTPVDTKSRPFHRIETTPTGIIYKFQIATDREETPFVIQGGSLDNFITLEPGEENISIGTNDDGMEEVSVILPLTAGPFFRILLTHP